MQAPLRRQWEAPQWEAPQWEATQWEASQWENRNDRCPPRKHGQRMAERAERTGTRWYHPTFACSGTRWNHPEFRLGANGFAEMLRNVQAPAGTWSGTSSPWEAANSTEMFRYLQAPVGTCSGTSCHLSGTPLTGDQ